MNEYLVYQYRVCSHTRQRWHPVAIVEAENQKEARLIYYYYSNTSSEDLLKAKPISQVPQRHIDRVYIGSLRYPVPQKNRHPQIVASFDF